MAEEKRVPIYIPEDALNEWETAKVVIINGEMTSIPVNQTVEVKPEVAEVIQAWLDGVKKARDDYKKRLKELEETLKK